MATMQKITANLWFGNNAEEVVNFYISVFKNSEIKRTTYYEKEGFEIHKMPEGTVMTIEFFLDGQEFVALNGGPHFKFNEAVSFIINCTGQQEVDYYWEKLTEGGDTQAQVCGWCKDKFGLSWQVVPTVLTDMFSNPDKTKREKAMKAMLQMKKIDIAVLEQAIAG